MSFLFGDPGPRRVRSTGIPADIGSGPDGEFCRTCRHATKVVYRSSGYFKCGLMRAHWAHSEANDIRLKWPACKFWEGKEQES